MSGELRVHELDIFIRKLKTIGGGAPKYLDAVLYRCMTNDLWPQWVSQISMNDHTLQDLRRLGHPYSTQEAMNKLHLDSFVHIQDGALLGGSAIVAAVNGTGYMLVNTTPQYVYLRYGTTKMRMRDPGGAALAKALPSIKLRFANEVKKAIVEFISK